MLDAKKKPYIASWALPFIFQESNGSRPVRVMMLGFHLPSKLGYPTRPSVVFARENNISQAIPFPGRDLPILAAGVISCSGEESILNSAQMLLKMTAMRDNVYRSFDFNKMEVIDAVRLAAKYGENWSVPHETSLDDLRFLRCAYSYDLLKGHSASVHTLLAIGKDIRYNIPVVLFKKSWYNFYDIMWMWDGGVRFLAGLMFLVSHPPQGDKYTFLSEYELDTGIKTWVERLSKQDFVTIDPKLAVAQIVDEVKSSDTR